MRSKTSFPATSPLGKVYAKPCMWMMSISSTTYLLYPGLLALAAGIWYQQVKSTVLEPYLVNIDHHYLVFLP